MVSAPGRLIAAALLAALLVGFVRAQGQPAGSPAGFSIEGDVQRPALCSPERLEQLPSTRLDVMFGTGAGPVRASFTGVLLWDLLQTAGVVTDPGAKNGGLRKTVVVTGRDGYRVVFSLGELDPSFGGQPVIVAYQKDGKPLDAKAGFARIIAPGDKEGGRDVSALASIRVIEPR